MKRCQLRTLSCHLWRFWTSVSSYNLIRNLNQKSVFNINTPTQTTQIINLGKLQQRNNEKISLGYYRNLECGRNCFNEFCNIQVSYARYQAVNDPSGNQCNELEILLNQKITAVAVEMTNRKFLKACDLQNIYRPAAI